jgi:peptide/nickel transport system substrate-binding protein
MALKFPLLRSLRSVALGASLGAAIAMSPSAASAQTVTAVMQSGLRVLDPIVSTAIVTSIHSLLIYDLLLAQDNNGKVQPQMASWQVSPDAKSYTFILRSGLKWHDGAPVTAEDCVASIKRWAAADAMGQVMMTMVSTMRTVDDKTFVIVLNQPNDMLLEALSKTSARPAFMMPKRMADTPPSQPIKENIGSGPFRFVAGEFKPGLKAVYEKNKDYVPRKEPVSGTAGGKVVNIDRLEWVTMPDPMTAVNALLNGEIDFLENVPYDLLPMVEGKKGVKVDVLNKQGSWNMFRMNFLYPPFNNKLLRQAAMYAVGQEEVLKALVGNPKFYKTCPAVFGCGMPYESQYGKEMLIPSNIPKAQELLKEGHYDGTPVVILQPSDNAFASQQPLVIAQALRKAGFKVDVQTMDWQTLTARRGNQKPPAEGGWNIFVTFSALADYSDPLRSMFVATAGKKSFFGWPDIPAIEEVRARFAAAGNAADRKRLAAEVQKMVIDEGVIVPLGQFTSAGAYSTKLSGVLENSRPLFWNVRKAK